MKNIFFLVILFCINVSADDSSQLSLLKSLSGEVKESLVESFNKKNWQDIVKKGFDQRLMKINDGTAEYLMGYGLMKMRLSVISYTIFADLIEKYPTSPIVDLALEGITENFKSGRITTSYVKEIFNKRLVKPTRLGAKAIYKFHRFLSLREKKYFEWSTKNRQKIPKGTFWSHYLDYLLLAKKTDKMNSKQIYDSWSRFLETENLGDLLTTKGRINKARAYYELGKYDKAEDLYKGIKIDRYSQGGILRERAWVYYRQNQFKKSLSMLSQMRSISYGLYHHVDEYLLPALIYRETCQTELLAELQKSLNKRIYKIKQDIMKIRNYVNNSQIFPFISSHPMMSQSGAMVTYLNQEIEEVKKTFTSDEFNSLNKKTEKLSQFSMKEINKNFISASREIIEKLFILKDQVDYLVYSLQLKRAKPPDLSYKSRVSRLRESAGTHKIVWPIYDEVWTDEISRYQSVLENRCI